MGAELLLYPTAIGSEPHDAAPQLARPLAALQQGHAAANLMPLVASNRVGVERGREVRDDFLRLVVHRRRHRREGRRGGRDGEAVLTATFDLEAMRAQRDDWGVFRDRRPELYGADPDARRHGRTLSAVTRLRRTAAALGAAALRGPVACVDLETTGGMAAHHRIIEVGIVLLDGGEVVEQWSSLVNPGMRIPSSIEDFTGISNEMVADAPPFEDLRAEVRRRLDGRLFVAHNARFDYGFVRNEFRRARREVLGARCCARCACRARCSASTRATTSTR